MSETTEELSFGGQAVGLSFNPSGDTPQGHNVDRIKRMSAELIDFLNNMRLSTDDGEVKRMCSVAITEAQTAQMWGVKAATWKGVGISAPLDAAKAKGEAVAADQHDKLTPSTTSDAE